MGRQPLPNRRRLLRRWSLLQWERSGRQGSLLRRLPVRSVERSEQRRPRPVFPKSTRFRVRQEGVLQLERNHKKPIASGLVDQLVAPLTTQVRAYYAGGPGTAQRVE